MMRRGIPSGVACKSGPRQDRAPGRRYPDDRAQPADAAATGRSKRPVPRRSLRWSSAALKADHDNHASTPHRALAEVVSPDGKPSGSPTVLQVAIGPGDRGRDSSRSRPKGDRDRESPLSRDRRDGPVHQGDPKRALVDGVRWTSPSIA